MTYRTDDAYRIEDDVDYEPEEPPKRRRWLSVIVVVALAIMGSASAFLWRAYGNNVPTSRPSDQHHLPMPEIRSLC